MIIHARLDKKVGRKNKTMKIAHAASITQTITNSTVIFSLIGLVAAVLFLITNAGMVGYTALHFPPPEVKNLVIKGFDEGPIKMFIDLEFPPTKMGYLISAQTEGPLDVSLFMSEQGAPLPNKASVSVNIKEGVDLNLASRRASRLVIDDLEINLNNDFNAKIISDLIMSHVLNNNSNKQQGSMKIPNLKVHVNTRVVVKSLWIPVAASISIPYKIDLTKILEKKKAEEGERTAIANTQLQVAEPKKVIASSSASSREELKRAAIANFNYKPRKVEITASDNSILAIDVIGAIPSALIPDFLTLSLPEIQLQVDFFKILNKKIADSVGVGKLLDIRIKPILLQAALDDPSKEIQIHAALRIEHSDAERFKDMLKLVRDQKFDEIGIQIRQPVEFIKASNKSSFMYWLRDFVLNIPIGDIVKELNLQEKKTSISHQHDDKKQNLKNNEKEETSRPGQNHHAIISSQPQAQAQKSSLKEARRAVSIKFAHAKRIAPNGGEFLMKITISRAFVDFLSGKLPEINLKSHLGDRTELVDFSISSEEIDENSESIVINVALRIKNMKSLIYTALLASGHGRNIENELKVITDKEEVVKRLKEMAKITTLQISGSNDNIISSLANIFSVDVKIGHEGFEGVTFKDSKTVIYNFNGDKDNPEIRHEEVENSSKKPETTTEPSTQTTPAAEETTIVKAKRNIKTYLAIENQDKNVNIGASIELEKQPYFGEYAHIGWGRFGLNLIYESKRIFNYNIQAGSIDVGLSQGIRPFFGKLVTGISIPADRESLTTLKNFSDKFLNVEDEFIDFSLEILYQGQSEAIVLDCHIPSKKLLEKLTEIRQPAPSLEKLEAEVDKKDPAAVVDREVKVKLAEHTNIDKHKKEQVDKNKDAKNNNNVAIITKPSRDTFLTNISNVILRLISIQAPTLVFHATYSNLNYCTQESVENYDDKISLMVSLPSIETNICQKKGACFARAGTTRPIIFKSIIIDKEICNLQSKVLGADAKLPDAFATKHVTPFKFENNEIPIFASITNLPVLIQVAEMASAKQPQSLTISHSEHSNNFNNVVGIVASSFVNIELPSKEPSAKTEPKTTTDSIIIDEKLEKNNGKDKEDIRTESESKEKEKKKVSERKFSNLPAVLEIGSSSKSSQELDLTVGFKLPEGSLKDLQTGVSGSKNHFKWPIIQWGNIDYNLGVKDIFSINLSINRGEIDIKKEGIVVPALENMAMKIKVDIDSKFYVGSTAIRQIVRFIKKYTSSATEKEPIFNSNFVPELYPKAEMIYYDFLMDGLRGVNDQSQIQASGEFKVTSAFEMIDIITNRPKYTVKVDKKEEELEKSKISNENSFKDIRVALKSNLSEKLPVLEVPCLVPALCSDQELRDVIFKPKKLEDSVNLSLEIFNVLKPATEIVSKSLGPVMEAFLMTEYPSMLKFQFTSLSDISTTILLDGSGFISIKLAPFEFSRTVHIPYASTEQDKLPVTEKKIEDTSVDIFSLNADISIPQTIIGVRSALNVFRAGTLLQPPVPPVYLYRDEKEEEKMKKKVLTNQPLNLGFSSDYPLQWNDQWQGNLFSALVNSFIKDLTIPGLGLKDVGPDTQAQHVSSKKSPINNSSTSGLGYFSWTDIGSMINCATLGMGCSRLDFVYNVDLPFDEERFEVDLPKTGAVRVFFEELPIAQVVADAKRFKRLILSKRSGITALGTVSVQLNGINVNEFGSKGADFDKRIPIPKSEASSTKLRNHFMGSNQEKTKFSVEILLGHDVSFSTNIHFPLYKIKNYMSKRFNLFNAVSGYLPNLMFSSKAKTSPALIDSKLLPLVSKTDSKHLACIDPDILPKNERKTRINNVDFQNSVIFYEFGHETVLPDRKFNLFLQLRTKEEEQICGHVPSAEGLKMQLRRLEDKQGFIKVKSIFGLQPPEADYKKIFKYVTFNEHSSVYEFNDSLPYPGRYEVSLIIKDKIYELPNTVVYVKNEF